MGGGRIIFNQKYSSSRISVAIVCHCKPLSREYAVVNRSKLVFQLKLVGVAQYTCVDFHSCMIVSGLSSNILAARGDRKTAFEFIPAGTVIQSNIPLGTARP